MVVMDVQESEQPIASSTWSERDGAESREDLVARCYGPTRRAMYAFCGNWDLAEEATQEAMARLWLKGPRADGANRPEAWAFVVGANYLRSRFRRTRIERRYAQRRASEATDNVRAESQASGNALATIVDRQALIDALRKLSPRQRQAVVLRHLLDASIDETATAMRCAPGTVRALTAQAVKALRTHLDTEAPPR